MIPYGRGATAISDNPRFGMNKQQAQDIIDDWFTAMPYVKDWVSGQHRMAVKGERQQTLLGRVRHYVLTDANLFHVKNEYANTPIQGIASDMTLFSLMRIHHWLVTMGWYCADCPEMSEAMIVGTVHDSILLEVKDNDELVEKIARKCQWFMADTPTIYIEKCPLPFKADAETGYKWGALEELE